MPPLVINEPERCLCGVKVGAVSLTQKGRDKGENTVAVSETEEN